MEKVLQTLPSLLTTDDELVQFNLYLTAGFVGVTLGLFSFILFSRWRDGYSMIRRKRAEKHIQDFLTAYIFDEDIVPEATEAFAKKYAKRGVLRQILIENIVSLHKNLLGESADKLRYLYRKLGLQQYSKRKLYSSSWHRVAKGISELADMGMQENSPLIQNFVNHPHPILRSEAQVALLKLEPEAPFSFLNDLKEPLLDWQQLQLARAAYKSQFLKIPKFEAWLGSKEESIVIFCLRMIAIYGQRRASDAILELLQHPSAKVREEAVVALRHLETYDAVPMLTSMFANEPTDVQLEILKTLPAISNQVSIPFYEQVLGLDNRSLQLAAAKAMCQSGQEGKARMEAIKNDPEHTLRQLAASALSHRS